MAIFYDGTGDYVTAPNHVDWAFGTGDFTICLWVRFNGLLTYTNPLINWDNMYCVGDYLLWAFYWYNSDDKLYLARYLAGVDESKVSTATWVPETGTWYHLAVIRIGNDLKFFVDAVQLGANVDVTGSDYDAAGQTEVLYIGYSRGATACADHYYLDGDLDDVRIYKGKGLSQAEIETVYHARGNDNITTGLKARWLMNEKPEGTTVAGASTVIDISGNSHQGSPAGDPTYAASPLKLVQPMML